MNKHTLFAPHRAVAAPAAANQHHRRRYCLHHPRAPSCVSPARTGAQPPEGERKLYLLIEAPTEAMVRRAKQEIRQIIEELVEKAMRRDVGAAGSRRYNIM